MTAEEARLRRQVNFEVEIGNLAYERFRLCREIEARQHRIDEIDVLIEKIEGALQESERVRLDIATQVAIDEAKAAATADEMEVIYNG